MQVRGENPPRAGPVELFHHGTAHSCSVPRFCAAAEFVNENGGFSGDHVQHLSNFCHLNRVGAETLRGRICGRHPDDEGVEEGYTRARHRTV